MEEYPALPKKRASKRNQSPEMQQEKTRSKEINKKARSRKDCTPEITVLLDCHFLELAGGGEIIARFKADNIDYRVRSLPIPGSIQWVRKHCTLYPGQPETTEDFVLIRLAADEFIQQVETEGLHEWFATQNSKMPRPDQVKMTLLIDSLHHELHGVQANKDYRERVLAIRRQTQTTSTSTSTSTATFGSVFPGGSRRASNLAVLDDAIAWLEIRGVTVRSFLRADEAVDYAHRLTLAVAHRPYAAPQGGHGGKNRKTGDVWVRMLAQLEGVSDTKAKAIAATYPSLPLFVEAIRADARAIVDIPVGRGRLGPVLAERLITLFTCDDPAVRLKKS